MGEVTEVKETEPVTEESLLTEESADAPKTENEETIADPPATWASANEEQEMETADATDVVERLRRTISELEQQSQENPPISYSYTLTDAEVSAQEPETNETTETEETKGAEEPVEEKKEEEPKVEEKKEYGFKGVLGASITYAYAKIFEIFD